MSITINIAEKPQKLTLRIKGRKHKNKFKNCDTEDIEDKEIEKPACQRVKPRRGPLPMKLRALPQSFWQQPNTSGVLCTTTFCPPLDDDVQSSGRVVGEANTDLLFSLFKGIKDDEEVARPPPLAKRGRPKKQKDANAYSRVSKDEDPFVTSAIVPQIHVVEEEDEKLAQGQQVLAMISMAGQRNTNPNCYFNSSYSQRLSDLVVNL